MNHGTSDQVAAVCFLADGPVCGKRPVSNATTDGTRITCAECLRVMADATRYARRPAKHPAPPLAGEEVEPFATTCAAEARVIMRPVPHLRIDVARSRAYMTLPFEWTEQHFLSALHVVSRHWPFARRFAEAYENAQQPISPRDEEEEEEVERVAKAIVFRDDQPASLRDKVWNSWPNEIREIHRKVARRAIAAMATQPTKEQP